MLCSLGNRHYAVSATTRTIQVVLLAIKVALIRALILDWNVKQMKSFSVYRVSEQCLRRKSINW